MKREPLEVECWFLIPLVRDSDRGLSTAVMEVARRSLARHVGRMDRPRNDAVGAKQGAVPGGWKPQGSADPIIDESRKYTVFVPPVKLDDLRSLLKKVANSFEQQEILLSIRGRRERIIPAPEDGFLG